MSNTLPVGPFGRFYTIEELIPGLIGVLNDFDPVLAERYKQRYTKIPSNRKADKQRLVDGLRKSLNKYAPIFTYVGHYPSNDWLWGVWIDLEALYRAEQKRKLVQSHFNPKGRHKYVLLQESSGLCLYERKNWQAVWKVE